MYIDRLMDLPDVILPNVDQRSQMSWFVFVVRLAAQFDVAARDRVLAGLRRHEIGCANYFPPIHLQPFYRQRFGYEPGLCPVAETVSTRTIALPFFNHMDATQVELVALTLKVMIDRAKLGMDQPAAEPGDEDSLPDRSH